MGKRGSMMNFFSSKKFKNEIIKQYMMGQKSLKSNINIVNKIVTPFWMGIVSFGKNVKIFFSAKLSKINFFRFKASETYRTPSFGK